jgi:hypothetical protein
VKKQLMDMEALLAPCLTGGVAAALTTKELFFCEADATGFEQISV